MRCTEEKVNKKKDYCLEKHILGIFFKKVSFNYHHKCKCPLGRWSGMLATSNKRTSDHETTTFTKIVEDIRDEDKLAWVELDDRGVHKELRTLQME